MAEALKRLIPLLLAALGSSVLGALVTCNGGSPPVPRVSADEGSPDGSSSDGPVRIEDEGADHGETATGEDPPLNQDLTEDRHVEADDTELLDEDANVAQCLAYGEPEESGNLPQIIGEASGMVSSSLDDQVLWLHNDSGDSARIFAISSSGELRATVGLDGITHVDWEDMARGPCGSAETGQCLYLGDIGDNDENRDHVVIHRIVEPNPADGDSSISEVETMTLRYPDDPHDAEAMVVDSTGRVLLLTKRSGARFRVYAADFRVEPEPIVLDLLVEVPSPPQGLRLVTAADLSADGRWLLVRTYSAAMEYRLGADQTLSDLGEVEALAVPTAREPQGEAIAYGVGGFWHVSEGSEPPLFFVPCEDGN